MKRILFSSIFVLGSLFAGSAVAGDGEKNTHAAHKDAANKAHHAKPNHAPHGGEHYTVDPKHSQVVFRYSHFGFSNITGRFDTVTGVIHFDDKNIEKSYVKVEIPVASLDTGVDALDEHLRGKDFFDATKYPAATFESTKVSKMDDHYMIEGNLTIKDISKKVTLHAKMNGRGVHPMNKKQAIGFDGKTNIKRTDFGVGAYAPQVGDDMQMFLTVEGTVEE